MRYLTFAVILITSIACNNRQIEDYTEHKIDLKNNLGQLAIYLPPEFDTTYSWLHQSDNICADVEMFRFANKKYSLLREDGFLYNVTPDSLYQLNYKTGKTTL